MSATVLQPVQCQIVNSDYGYEGVITDAAGKTVFKTDFEGCVEDADAEMARVILRYKWKVKPGGGP